MIKTQNEIVKLKVSTFTIILSAIIFLFIKNANAIGTPSGTVITDMATIIYNVGTNLGLKATTSTAFVVDNKVSVTVTKKADAAIRAGSTNQALVFLVTNTGNTPQRYALSATNGAGIVMDNVRIYLDNGDIPNEWDAGDTLYVDASTFGDVLPDRSLNILIVADAPAGATDGQTSDYNLIATTVDAGTTTVTTQTAGSDTSGVDVVFADVSGSAVGDIARDGKHSASGRYTISSLTLTVVKSVLIYSDPSNGTTNPKAISGATLRYTITVTITGTGTARNVVITDPIPANTTYIPGTLKLNGAPLTDAMDTDSGNVGGVPVTITVNLGDQTNEVVHTITFEVKID